MREKVLKFINEFKDGQFMFLNGKCYWFAVILKSRFNEGNIVYNPVMNHWAVEIDEELYDVSGIISNDGFYLWPGEFPEDNLHYNRLIRQCITYEGEE